jgi:putative tricarboxylic transport membrane protein
MYVIMRVMGVKLFPIILRIKKSYLLPVVLICCLVGCYNINNDIGDVWASFLFGAAGYILNKYQYPLVPIVITLVLGPMFEKQLRIAMVMTDGSLMPFLTTPIPLVFLIMAVFSIIIPLVHKRNPAKEPPAA